MEERLGLGVALGSLVPVLLAIAIAGQGFRLNALDVGFVAIILSVSVWFLRRQLARSIATAPRVPPHARLESTRTTAWRDVRFVGLVAVPLALLAIEGGGAEAVLCAALAVTMVSNALQLKRWQRRTGKQVYRDRKIWARGAPFFYLSS
jgi:hypothetical protein